MFLVMLKSLPDVDFKDASINKVIGLTDELLYYAHETEKIDISLSTPLLEVLDEVDRVNSHHARDIKNHWTHARDSPATRGSDEYREGRNCNFLALAVQARLVKYVRAKLNTDSNNLHKRGRPLLDYALHPRRSTPIRIPYHSQREDPSIDTTLIELLLDHGEDPNQLVNIRGKSDPAMRSRQFVSLTQVCRSLRKEFRPLYMADLNIHISFPRIDAFLKTLVTMSICFHKDAKPIITVHLRGCMNGWILPLRRSYAMLRRG
jgi:hypothetical protein